MSFTPPPNPGSQGLPPAAISGVADDTQSQVALTLNGTPFFSQETPSSLTFGLEQMLAVHTLVGGSRVIQALGPRPKDISWEGKLRGSQAYVDARVRSIITLAKTGQVITLAWLTYAYDVVVMEFEPNWRHQYRNDYKITVKVLRDQSGTFAQSSADGIDSQVFALYNSATSSLNSLLTGYPSINPSALQTSLLSKIKTALAALGQALTTAGGLSSLGAALAAGNAGAILGVLQGLVPNIQAYIGTLPGNPAQQLIDAQTLLAGVVLIQKNLTAGQAANVIVAYGGSLYDLAAKYYGDPSKAQAIAQAQTPPLLTLRLAPGVATTLVIPPLGSMTRS